MVGDREDMLRRLRAVLPARWFPDDAPILEGLLTGLSTAWQWSYDLLHYVRMQTRAATATDIWLDIIALDFFGNTVVRRQGQGDLSFRNRIRRELFRERATRGAIVAILEDLTGRSPVVFEPSRITDTGGYGSFSGGGGAVGYGVAGGWGSLNLPFQCFITAFRPLGSGIATVSGWSGTAAGYGIGAIEYASLEMIQGQVTDSEIYSAVAEVLPIATTGWTRITN